ncbi:MAG: hypothetical protein J6Y54_04670, partial [Lentisphaeria bacterium]|nr:hypothetical protein [Lentisphaeria bacterium]
GFAVSGVHLRSRGSGIHPSADKCGARLFCFRLHYTPSLGKPDIRAVQLPRTAHRANITDDQEQNVAISRDTRMEHVEKLSLHSQEKDKEKRAHHAK